MLRLAAFLALVPLLDAASRYPTFTISGRLTCHGKPVVGNIMMIDDNISVFDYLLSEKPVGHQGMFRLTGEPVDNKLDVLLIVEHKCHTMKHVTHQRYQRHRDQKVDVYSKVKVGVEELIESHWKLEKNIELEGLDTNMAMPIVPTWKAYLYANRIIYDRTKILRDII